MKRTDRVYPLPKLVAHTTAFVSYVWGLGRPFRYIPYLFSSTTGRYFFSSHLFLLDCSARCMFVFPPSLPPIPIPTPTPTPKPTNTNTRTNTNTSTNSTTNTNNNTNINCTTNINTNTNSKIDRSRPCLPFYQIYCADTSLVSSECDPLSNMWLLWKRFGLRMTVEGIN